MIEEDPEVAVQLQFAVEENDNRSSSDHEKAARTKTMIIIVGSAIGVITLVSAAVLLYSKLSATNTIASMQHNVPVQIQENPAYNSM